MIWVLKIVRTERMEGGRRMKRIIEIVIVKPQNSGSRQPQNIFWQQVRFIEDGIWNILRKQEHRLVSDNLVIKNRPLLWTENWEERGEWIAKQTERERETETYILYFVISTNCWNRKTSRYVRYAKKLLHLNLNGKFCIYRRY